MYPQISKKYICIYIVLVFFLICILIFIVTTLIINDYEGLYECGSKACSLSALL